MLFKLQFARPPPVFPRNYWSNLLSPAAYTTKLYHFYFRHTMQWTSFQVIITNFSLPKKNISIPILKGIRILRVNDQPKDLSNEILWKVEQFWTFKAQNKSNFDPSSSITPWYPAALIFESSCRYDIGRAKTFKTGFNIFTCPNNFCSCCWVVKKVKQ